jgi:hypothetical protein
MEDAIKSFYDSICGTAVKDFDRDGKVDGLIFILPPKGKGACVVPIFPDKEVASYLTKRICATLGAEAGVVVSEAWVVESQDGKEWDGISPSERLDRQEVLQASLVSRGETIFWYWKILKECGASSRKLSPPVEYSDGQGESSFFGDYLRMS